MSARVRCCVFSGGSREAQTYFPISPHGVRAGPYVGRPDGDWVLSTCESLADEVSLIAMDALFPLAVVYDKLDLVSGTP